MTIKKYLKKKNQKFRMYKQCRSKHLIKTQKIITHNELLLTKNYI